MPIYSLCTMGMLGAGGREQEKETEGNPRTPHSALSESCYFSGSVFLVVDCLYVQASQKGRQNYNNLSTSLVALESWVFLGITQLSQPFHSLLGPCLCPVRVLSVACLLHSTWSQLLFKDIPVT